ncbi:alpha/beta fold hydrolase [Actinacidiphila acidipaludis]|uniref:Alpha/beta hydrolase n=1 Tax=Actinacidiphila acidipaludis TaxID=2873382 RepID=A0ABS7QB40_9ACTN|nr:alpha/beta hydrolase [Streptomyces acidipaludis]MBY8879919.1 alpha/beta hydrolase [Streptomyces acidipaludis]
MTAILLVHGAIADGSSWSRVIPLLKGAGHEVVAVQQPLSSIPDDVAKVRSVLEELDGPVVVVGHSFGGVVITQAAHDAANVSAMVYVAAFAPDEGESAQSLGEPYGQLESASHFKIDKQGRFTLPQELFPKYFCPDVEPEQAKVMAAVQGASDAARFGFVSGPPAWREHPTHFIVSENDQIIQPELERFCADRMKARTTVAEGAGHAVMVSQPQVVAQVILDAAS